MSRLPSISSPDLFWLCFRWGLVAGATSGTLAGALIGALAGLDRGYVLATFVGLLSVGAGYGIIIGAVVSVIPSVLAGSAVASSIRRRSNIEAVRRDLALMLCTFILLVNVGLYAIFFGGGSGIAESLAVQGAANLGLIGVLWKARESISRAWSKALG
jgi:hypothetical protein